MPGFHVRDRQSGFGIGERAIKGPLLGGVGACQPCHSVVIRAGAHNMPACHVQDCQSGFGIGERVIQGCSWVALVPVCRAIPLRFGQHITCPSVMYEIVSQASGSANVSQRGR